MEGNPKVSEGPLETHPQKQDSKNKFEFVLPRSPSMHRFKAASRISNGNMLVPSSNCALVISTSLCCIVPKLMQQVHWNYLACIWNWSPLVGKKSLRNRKTLWNSGARFNHPSTQQMSTSWHHSCWVSRRIVLELARLALMEWSIKIPEQKHSWDIEDITSAGTSTKKETNKLPSRASGSNLGCQSIITI